MSMPGPKPTGGETRFRGQLAHDWTEVPNEPYAGPRPTLPATRTVTTRDGVMQLRLTRRTRDWWDTIASMPHCRLWSDSDWMFALETAVIVVDAAFRGDTKAAAELRARARILGVTMDARRDLRIRYVDPKPDPEPPATTTRPERGGAEVTDIAASRRRRLTAPTDAS